MKPISINLTVSPDVAAALVERLFHKPVFEGVVEEIYAAIDKAGYEWDEDTAQTLVFSEQT